MVYGCYTQDKDQAQYAVHDWCVFKGDNILFVSQMSGLVKNCYIGIYSDTMYVINVEVCMMVLLIELYLFIPLSVTLTIFQGNSTFKQF